MIIKTDSHYGLEITKILLKFFIDKIGNISDCEVPINFHPFLMWRSPKFENHCFE